MSNPSFNHATRLAIVCPITNTDRGVPFHVPVPEGAGVAGFVVVEQGKAVDYSARRWRRVGQVDREVVDEALAILEACFE